jgi:hypothetical protein
MLETVGLSCALIEAALNGRRAATFGVCVIRVGGEVAAEQARPGQDEPTVRVA